MIRTANQRALIACAGMAVCFTAFSARLVHLQVTMHDAYVAKAAGQNTRKVPIFARRGTIADIRGESLAQNEPVKTVIADASLITDQSAFAAILAGPLDMPVGIVREKLARTFFSKSAGKDLPLRYIVLKKEVPESSANAISKLVAAAKKDGLVSNADAILFDQDSVRTYPNNSMLCHIVGYINNPASGWTASSVR